LQNCPQLRLLSFHSASITAAAATPTATPIKGLSTANQKEIFQPESLLLGFLFMIFSQAFKGGHFTKPEMFSANVLGAVHTVAQSMPD
jgi:hypothetical protein